MAAAGKSEDGGALSEKRTNADVSFRVQDERVRDKVTNILGDWIEKVLAGKWKPASAEAHL